GHDGGQRGHRAARVSRGVLGGQPRADPAAPHQPRDDPQHERGTEDQPELSENGAGNEHGNRNPHERMSAGDALPGVEKRQEKEPTREGSPDPEPEQNESRDRATSAGGWRPA